MAKMGRITVRKSTMVRPAQETPRERLWLSVLDLVAPPTHTPSVRFYLRPDHGGVPLTEGFFDGDRMRRSLAEALVPFYPLAGRLSHDSDGRLEVNCNGEGVQFIEADAADTTMDDYGDFAPTMELRRLVPAVEYTDDFSVLPLLLLQVTHFKCGGVCLGVGTHHYVSDGMSTAHFINTWSQICRGAQISSNPSIDRTLLRGREPPSPSFQHVEYQPAPAMLSTTSQLIHTADESSMLTATTVSIFKLTRSDLVRLRSEITEDQAASRLSTFAILAAHVWRCVSVARGLPPEQPTMLFSAVDGRKRLQPPLSDGYFGNVIFTVAPVAMVGTEISGLADGAEIIQAALDRMDNDYCRSALDYLQQQPDLSALAREATTFQYNLGLTSWVRLPIHDADFGWGRPVFMGPGGIATEGLAFVLPSANRDGSISIAICLRADHMEKFKSLIYEPKTEHNTCCSKL